MSSQHEYDWPCAAHFLDDEGSAQHKCVVEQVVVLSSASFDLAVGGLSLGPALVDRQVAEAELAPPLLLHFFQPLPGRHLLEDLALRGRMPLLATIPGHA
jgi:hypothetical protein